MIYLVNGVNVTQQTRFQQVLGETVNELAKRASVYSPNDQFVNETDFTSSQRIYGLVQCTQDLSEDDCNRCLTFAINNLPQCCTGQQGARVLLPSCNVRYESYLFYREVATVPPPLVSLLVPSSPPPNTNGITDVQSLQFDLRIIQAATNNFSYENKIGEGGFGMVYKGTLANGQEIVVKRLSKGSDKAQKNLRMRLVPIASVVKCIIEWGHSSKRAHVNWNYVFWAIVFPRLAEQVQCATTYPNGESLGGSWATNGHHPTRVSPGVVSLGCCGSLYGHLPR
ncbi:hypothetical protein LguiA_002524 [Lonicera macranthoides]